MTSFFDPAEDFAAVADCLEPVTFRPASGSDAIPVAGALRREVTTREAAESDGKYTTSDVRWHLASADVPSVVQPGDRISDQQGETWTILEARLTVCRSRWECSARNLAIAGRLDSYVTILRERVTKGLSGAVERAFEPYRTNVRARIQESQADRHELHGRQSGVVKAKIFMAEQILVDNGFRVQAADGTLYEVEGYEQPDSIDGLFIINAVRWQ